MSASELELKGDAPLESSADDEFGLGEIVAQLADTLAHRVRPDGYTLGIEGPWGSGKSTLVNLISERLKTVRGKHVIRFEPWLIGEKSALLAAFFAKFASEIDLIETTNPYGSSWDRWQRNRATKALSKQIRKYGEYIAALATPVGGLAAADPTGVSALVAVGLKGVGTFSQFFGKAISLETLKSQIVAGLTDLRKVNSEIRFTVIVDDIDRIPASEAVEILRMVQKVADFPATTYLICFDSSVLSIQVREVSEVQDGRLYIEKIFQDVIHVPPQEPFALRRSLKRKLESSFPTETIIAEADRDVQYRQQLIFDRWVGEFIKTPRDVARLYDAVLFGWPSLPEGADFYDFVWLQLVSRNRMNFTRGRAIICKMLEPTGMGAEQGIPNQNLPPKSSRK
jgi:predicted KAP-like P-loop ATPase